MSRPARATIALLAIAACARTPAAPPPKAPAPTTSAAPAPRAPATLRNSGEDIVGTVAFRDGVVYALTWGGHLRAWTGDAQPARTVDLGRVLAIAQDGSVAATKTKDGDDSDRLDVWALPDLTRVQTRSFAHGIDGVLALSRAMAYVRVNFHNHGSRGDGALMSMPPPQWEDVFWNFASGTVDENRVYRCDPLIIVPGFFMFSADGRYFACTNGAADVAWRDLRRGDYGAPELARDWRPPAPPRDRGPDMYLPSKPGAFHTAPHWVLSLRLTPEGKDVYVTYHRGTADGGGWRLERWTPGKTDTPGRLTRLASEDVDALTSLLAISRDGRVAVLGAGREPLVIRRAPRWEAERLAAEGATAAAVSIDGKRIATGHADGSLRLWDVATGRLIATAVP